MLHFVPFLAGAAGAAITYIVKDRETRERIRNGADRVLDEVRDGIDRAGRAGKALVRPSAERSSVGPDADSASTPH